MNLSQITTIFSTSMLFFYSLSILCDDSNDKLLENCGQRPRNARLNRIVGGSDAFYGEVPWQVMLQVKVDEAVMQCGAALINQNWILTAAHCIEIRGIHCKEIIAFFGKHKLNGDYLKSDTLKRLFDDKNNKGSNPYMKWLTNGNSNPIVTRKASKVIVNEKFNSNTFENDIALIKLNQSIKIEDNIQPICLPQQMEDFSGQTAHILGFGVLEFGAKQVPPILQIVSVPILSKDYCKDLFQQLGHKDVVKRGKLCAGVIDGGKDACAGDSGGPLSVKRSKDNKWVLAGIISNGIKCGQPNIPGMYTQVSAYVDWINKVINSEIK